MARLTLDQVRHVAQLAALDLSEPEAQAMQEDLGSILDYIAALEAVDVSGIEAVFHPSQTASPLRLDAVQPSLSRAAALSAAPESEQGGFAVPRVLDGDT